MLTREQLLKGGSRGPAIKPGDATGSLLFQVVSQPGKLVMPPAGKLTEDETRILRSWIDQGAVWPAGVKQAVQSDWWAFCKPLRPKVPGTASEHPVDAFLMEKLRAARIEPALEADRLTLLRRACFDLHGLPPTPEQITGFLNDTCARRMGAADRFAAGVAAIWREVGPPLAGPGALWRHLRFRAGPVYSGSLALSRLRDQVFQRRQALRPVRERADRRRRALARRSGSTHGHWLFQRRRQPRHAVQSGRTQRRREAHRLRGHDFARFFWG